MAGAELDKVDDVITAKNVDLSSCDRELIQFPAAIQPQGVMLTVDEQSKLILQASANCTQLLSLGPQAVVGKGVDSVLGNAWPDLLIKLQLMTLGSGPIHVARESIVGRDKDFNLFAHRSGGLIILEFEFAPTVPTASPLSLYTELRADISALQFTKSLQEFFDLAVQKIRNFTGFDRVMAYRFAEDGSGQVVAESKLEELETYLGLHYPASDIPAPARRLFALSWVRHLPNVSYVPVPLMPEIDTRDTAPVDMSFAMLRSVSIMYTDYLKNMGVKSTMVIPLMKEGKLWGLISAMHHQAPRHVPYETRMAAEFLAHTLSLLMSAKEDAETFERLIEMSSNSDRLVQALTQEADFLMALGTKEGLTYVLKQVSATGAALISGPNVSLVGKTPSVDDVRTLVDWIANREEPLFVTDRLPSLFEPAEKYSHVASGVLAVRISANRSEFLVWFRPEQIEVVSWAGDPRKPVDVSETDGKVRLRPRGSFALWKQSVRNKSIPWDESEKSSVLKLRLAIGEVILGRTKETERLNRELAASNKELDSFAYAASHDLKEPLRGIHHLVTFLKRTQGDVLDEEGKQQIATILKLTQRMDNLIDALLDHSRIGRTALETDTVNLDDTVESALLEFGHLLSQTGTQVRRPCSLGFIRGDRVRVGEVFANLIGNSIKYNNKAVRWIEIGVEPGNPPRYYVRDNGIGIAEPDQLRIFEIFRRLHGREEFGGGTGVGLAIVRKVVERHGGRIWVQSLPGEGATFYFTLGPADMDSRPD